MKQKSCHRLIYKLHTKRLKDSKWNLTLDLQEELHDYPEDVISLGSSQLLRWIDELNGVTDIDMQVRNLQRQIKAEKKKPRSRETKAEINRLYNELYDLQFQKDYVCIIMDSEKDYDRANQGFTINGIQYRRFLGTNGGIKNSTIVYVNKALYPELKRRLDNGRKMDVPLVPAKLEAYQALVCSGSTPIPEPNGIIVVKDCITHFKEDIILINDENDGEPVMTYEKDYEIEHNDSDGYGLMLPSYSRKVNGDLTGDYENTISGMNTRYAWTKGMVYTFDFIDFAEKVAGTYEVTDVWGQKRDVRNAEVILTESMLKLWNCYDSWEDYYENCKINKYQFSTPKTTPTELENSRLSNYQFLQNYDLTNEEIKSLCDPTIKEIQDVMGLDYRKSLVFLCGVGLDETKVSNLKDNYIKALMLEPELINDEFIQGRIHSMIRKRIDNAKKGSIKIKANYAMLSGDPFALCQSIFKLEITGLLKKGEAYHKYWADKGAKTIICFRAPMSVINNIAKMHICNTDESLYWFRFIKTAVIFNAFDTACDAMNGADKDGDSLMCTDNEILIKKLGEPKTILCVQRRADKKIVCEEDIIKANKLAFNDDIGTVTNHVTSMIERQAGFKKGTKEYETLSYRIMCGELFQQNCIDRSKGIIAKPMPEYWYSSRDMIRSEDQSEDNAFNLKIVAQYKPYFMIYIYPNLKAKLFTYLRNSERKVRRKFRRYKINSVSELTNYSHKTEEMNLFLYHYEIDKKIGCNPCTVNRICWLIENSFKSKKPSVNGVMRFDYNELKVGVQYTREDYIRILNILNDYNNRMGSISQKERIGKLVDGDEERHRAIEYFKTQSRISCPNESELCDIIIDMCGNTAKYKSFVWEVVGDVIIQNLLKKHDYKISFPVCNGDEFEYGGEMFSMKTVQISGDRNDCFE